jgi:hypothetical protein
MKTLSLLLLLCFFGCQRSDSVIVLDDLPAPAPKKPRPEYLVDSFTIKGKMYRVVQQHPWAKNGLPLRVLYKGDTIYRHDTAAGNGFEFEDFNGDGVLDIRMDHLTNVGGSKEWIVFDPKAQRFKNIKGFFEFPATEKLPGTKYFYSDHRMGCAGGMWGSELFYIDNFEAKAIARIFIVTCEGADYAQGVTIFKINGNDETIVTQLDEVPEEYSSRDYAEYFSYYWSNNYKKFE